MMMADGTTTRDTADSEFALRIRDLAKRFGKTTALNHAGLELRRGERLALLGPNGAGKTTLVRCICGRSVPDSGSIEMLGRRLPPSGGRQRTRLCPAGDRPLPRPDRPREPRGVRSIPRSLTGRRSPRGGRLGARVDRSRRPGPRSDQDLFERDETAGQHRVRCPPPAPRPAARRADGRGRSAEPRPHLRDARGAVASGHLDPPDHPSTRRGGAAVRSDRHHRPRPRHRRGDARANSSRARWAPTAG